MATRKKKPAVRIQQMPGGNQTFSIGGGAAPAPQQNARPNAQRRPSLSSHNPFNPQGQAPQAKSSVAVRANNPTFTPNVHSPFSNEPLPQSNRQTRVNKPSGDAPWNPNAAQQPPQRRNPARQPKANIPSAGTPISFNPNAKPQPKLNRRDSKANIPSAGTPISFDPNAPAAAPPRRSPAKANNPHADSPFNPGSKPKQQRSAFRVQQTPGGHQNINLFGDNSLPKHKPRRTPTTGYSQQAPWNPNAPQQQAGPPKPRAAPKANVPSAGTPISFNPNAPAAPAPRRAAPKANVPNPNSPFSNAPQPQPRQNSQVTRTTQNERQHRSAVRLHHPPGGQSNFRIGQ